MQDLRYAVRQLIRSRGFTFITLLALTLGIGANTAIFSVVNTVLLRPLPYPIPERLVAIQEKSRKLATMSVSYPNFVDYRDLNGVFEQMTAYRWRGMDWTNTGEPERLDAYQVSANFFDLLGVAPAHGRTFLPAEDRPEASPVAVLANDLWQNQFHSDPGVIGQVITLNGLSYTVIGIMPASFQFPRIAQLWVPFGLSANSFTDRGTHSGLNVLARLKPGVTLQQARAEMDTISGRLEQQYPNTNTGVGVVMRLLTEQVVRDIRPALLVLLGAVGFVLLIACANVANLMLTRAAARQKEIAVRSAMGAARGRLIRQLLTESVFLAVLGGSLGILLADLAINTLKRMAVPGSIPRLGEISIDTSVLGFTLAISLLTGMIFGLAPALKATKLDLVDALSEGGRTSGSPARNSIRSLLVISETALALMLLIGGALMIKGFLKIMQIDPGFKTEDVLTADLALPSVRYPDGQKQTAFYRELLSRLHNMLGVTAGIVNPLPMGGAGNQSPALPEGRPVVPEEEVTTDFLIASPDYFDVLGIPLLGGRHFTDLDNETAQPVVIIDQATAERFWPNEDPIGKRLSFETSGDASARIPRWRMVIGVVGNVRHYGLTSDSRQQLYVSYQQMPTFYNGILPPLSLVVKSKFDQRSLVSKLRGEVLTLDSKLPIYNTRTMEQILSESTARRRLSVWLMGTFAAVALILSGIGIFGVMSQIVTQRTHEIGVRMALGANRGQVLNIVVGQGMLLAVVGLVIGVIGAFFLTPVMSSLLFAVNAADKGVFVLITLLLLTVALIACILPALRATKVDPQVALREL
jgi:putative ABC transport system permease protein